MSFQDKGSELNEVDSFAHHRLVNVSDDFWCVLEKALERSRITQDVRGTACSDPFKTNSIEG